ncbi:MAG: sigma-70 family RNA polymerase sigma factor [Actinomycetota bacterium]
MQEETLVGTETAFSQASDSALVVAISRWEQSALQEAYVRHGGGILALARRVTGDRGLAEDVVQEVFVRLWYEPQKFDPERGSLRTYLMTNCHGRSVDMVRSETARRAREAKEGRAAVSETYEPQREIEAASDAKQVREVLGALPEPEREAIELAYFGGRTYREVAGLLNVAEGTIKSRIRAGLRKMRNSLAEEGLLEA